ncbi:hypothetical protein BS17DRAFT_840769 [Gyrodon lividus]|nr:hypothetical protein BS17DRAFT_840769 [Gyrodon lividus]
MTILHFTFFIECAIIYFNLLSRSTLAVKDPKMPNAQRPSCAKKVAPSKPDITHASSPPPPVTPVIHADAAPTADLATSAVPEGGSNKPHQCHLRPAVTIEEIEDEENFNLDRVTSGSEDEDAASSRAPGRRTTTSTEPSYPLSSQATIPDPLLNLTGSSQSHKKNSAADVQYFFRRLEDQRSECTECR